MTQAGDGAERVGEAALILSELGFMALAGAEPESPELRLCHCPLREVVEVTRIPCRVERGFVRELLGGDLTRLTYIPAGRTACTYRSAAPPPAAGTRPGGGEARA